jgi:hypothetical protein
LDNPSGLNNPHELTYLSHTSNQASLSTSDQPIDNLNSNNNNNQTTIEPTSIETPHVKSAVTSTAAKSLLVHDQNHSLHKQDNSSPPNNSDGNSNNNNNQSGNDDDDANRVAYDEDKRRRNTLASGLVHFLVFFFFFVSPDKFTS